MVKRINAPRLGFDGKVMCDYAQKSPPLARRTTGMEKECRME